jgi:hypothetical protein
MVGASYAPQFLLEGSLHSHEFHDAAVDIPVLYVKVAVFVPIGPMRSGEDAFYPVFLLNFVQRLSGVGFVPKYGYD